MKQIASIVAILTLSASMVIAKEAKEKKQATPEEAFKKLDSNGDGKVSEAEFLASPGAQKDAEKAKEKFKSLDADKDGSLTLEELSAAPAKKKKKE
jgi:Ca2+-binding EF-hand superfamily protein